MHFDLITIFPQFFDVLELSMLGKARAAGLLEVSVHDLRDFASGRHRAVDDSPAGGGAGMVMRPDVWGKAIDECLPRETEGCVLAIPTPSGRPLTQKLMTELSSAHQIIVACGRYEGIDARVGEHYRSVGVEVLEFSLGDYVLNGGEVAGVVLVEGVGRLLEGFVGNPESLVEESHGEEGLLEYPVYTHPRTWRELQIPPVLASGNHGAISRWRRDRALERTAERRPDLLLNLSPTDLDSADRAHLAQLGWLALPQWCPVEYRVAALSDVPEVSALAARTFPDACPEYISAEDRDDFIAEELSIAAFEGYLNDPDFLVFVAKAPAIVSYVLVGKVLPAAIKCAPPASVYISKCYTDPDFRGSGVTAALMSKVLVLLANDWGAEAATVATNISNKRAAKFYRRLGFRKVGRRHFQVGSTDNIDDVFVADLTRYRDSESRVIE